MPLQCRGVYLLDASILTGLPVFAEHQKIRRKLARSREGKFFTASHESSVLRIRREPEHYVELRYEFADLGFFEWHEIDHHTRLGLFIADAAQNAIAVI